MKLAVLLFIGLALRVNCSGFLSHLPLTMARNVSDPSFRRALFAELDDVLGGNLSESTKQRVEEIDTRVTTDVFFDAQKFEWEARAQRCEICVAPPLHQTARVGHRGTRTHERNLESVDRRVDFGGQGTRGCSGGDQTTSWPRRHRVARNRSDCSYDGAFDI